MSEAEKSDKAERRERAEARLARSRPARDAAAAAHASRMLRTGVREAVDTSATPDRAPALSRLEAKVLDAANEVLAASGGEGQRIAEFIRGFIDARIAR